MDKYVKWPVSDLASTVGLVVVVLGIVIVAKHTPFVKKFV